MSLKYQKFLLFGDSITEFAFNTRMEDGKGDQFSLGAALCRDYTRKLDIVQRGFSGYTSRWALKLLPQILESEVSSEIVLCTIFFGTNDAASAGNQRVELPEFKQNITTLVHMLKAKDIHPILVGPALHDEKNWTLSKPDQAIQKVFRSSNRNKLYSDTLKDIATAEDVGFVDLHKAFTVQGGSHWQELLCDGVHFTGKGYEVFYNALLDTIRATYPQYAPESVSYKLPNWREVQADGSNLDRIL
ncbi:LADA_0H17502g1_1 [Lachancea dasiensis]|uniref:LADA_0H17502g1_1 n=1 Tax=Lachancea dasiensis TaxID=1072105 RepID=A0A1G4K5J7_9SACH|nr:LADA_0H17502g1_1 [Lachancea dasiensis]